MTMNSDFDRLDLLLNDLFDIGLEAARLHELSAILAADPEAQSHYIDESSFHALLEWQSGALFPLRDAFTFHTQTDPSNAMVLPAISDTGEADPAEPVVLPASPAITRAKEAPAVRVWRSIFSLRGAGIAAAILIAVSIGIAVMVHFRKPQIVATLISTDGASWQAGFAPRSGEAEVAEGEQLSLENGSVDIAFGGGASVTIQAPAQFFADSAGAMTLTSGSMAVVVPERARGFTVSTPDAIVKDLGTEFGVKCGPTTETQIQVFIGTVQASLRSGQASTTTLFAGDTARVSAGVLTIATRGMSAGAFPPHEQGVNLPPGFHDEDVGTSAVPGAAEYSPASGQWTISGVGHDTWLARDRFNMVEKQLEGDATIFCRILTPTTEADGNREDASKCGVMFRTSLDPESPFVSLVFTEAIGVQMLSRDISATNVKINGPYATPVETPLWLKLSRVGDTFTGTYSFDGIKWYTVSTHALHMPTMVHAGLMLSSHNPGHVGTATFSDVSITNNGPAR